MEIWLTNSMKILMDCLSDMRDSFQKKYLSWRGRCGAYAKHYGHDERLKRMNAIRKFYWAMYCKGTPLEGLPEI